MCHYLRLLHKENKSGLGNVQRIMGWRWSLGFDSAEVVRSKFCYLSSCRRASDWFVGDAMSILTNASSHLDVVKERKAQS